MRQSPPRPRSSSAGSTGHTGSGGSNRRQIHPEAPPGPAGRDFSCSSFVSPQEPTQESFQTRFFFSFKMRPLLLSSVVGGKYSSFKGKITNTTIDTAFVFLVFLFVFPQTVGS